MNYLEEIRKESQKFYKKANKTNWAKLSSKFSRVRKDYGKRIGG